MSILRESQNEQVGHPPQSHRFKMREPRNLCGRAPIGIGRAKRFVADHMRGQLGCRVKGGLANLMRLLYIDSSTQAMGQAWQSVLKDDISH